MTDQQRATICSRCGGLAGRCECAEIRREAFAEAAAKADWAAQRMNPASGAHRITVEMADELHARARKPEPL